MHTSRLLHRTKQAFAKLAHFLVLSLSVSGESSASDWKQFGGPNGDFSLNISIPENPSQAKVLWSRELGFGNSGIVGDTSKIYTQFREISINGIPSDNESVISLDASTGKTIWKFNYPQTPLPDQENYGGGNGPHSTPCLHNEMVFITGFAGDLYALRQEDGTVVWNRNLVEEFGATPVQFGFASSPIIHEDRLLVSAAGKNGGLLALNPDSGKVIWHSPAAEPSYATPIIDRRQDSAQIIYLTRDEIQAIQPGSGKILWKYELPKEGLTNVPSPMLINQDQFFIAGQGAQGAVMFQSIMRNGSPQISQSWSSKRINFFHQSFVEFEEMIIGGESFLYGIEAQSGRILWKERGYENTNLLRTGNKLLALSQNGWLSLLKANKEKIQSIWKTQLFSGDAWTPPTIIDEMIYARNRKCIAALSFSKPDQSKTSFPTPVDVEERSIEFSKRGDWKELKAFWNDLKGQYSALTAATIADRLQSITGSELAIEFLKQLSDSLNQSIPMIELSARYALKGGYPAEARMLFKQLVTQDPENASAKHLLEQLTSEEKSGNTKITLPGYEKAKLITIAGSFNQWDPFHTIFMRQNDTWVATLDLSAGNYEYKLVVDGNWMLDPSNKATKSDGNGNVNSVLKVAP